MIALGLTEQEARPACPAAFVQDGVVLTEQVYAATPRARLARQLEMHRSLDVFVPFACRMPIPAQAAQDWARQNQEDVTDCCARLRGLGQVTIVAQPISRPRPETGAAWMAAQAAAAQARRRLAEFLTSLARQRLVDHKIAGTGPGVALHSLVSKTQAQEVMAWLQSSLSHAEPATQEWRIAITGDWPPAAFCDARPLDPRAA